jgi:hypothetical protein
VNGVKAAVSHLPVRCLILATCALAVLLVAPAARAEVPSVDAYGGEALVLGTPHHHGGGTNQRSGGGGHSEGSSESSASSGNSRSSGGGGSSSTGSGGSGSSEGGGATTHPGSGGNNGTQPIKASGSAGGGAASKGGSQPITPVSSTSAFSAGDILLIFAGLLCIVGVGVVLRVARKPVGDGP